MNSNLLGIQMISLLFSILMIYISFLHYKRREMKKSEFFFWLMIWTGGLFLTLWPKSTDFILKTFKINRLLDLATIVGFMLLVAIGFFNYLRIRILEKKIEQLVRKEALKKIFK